MNSRRIAILFLLSYFFVFPFDLFSESFDPGLSSPFKIRRIIINRKDVFSTGTSIDSQFPYSWANNLHILTQESFIRGQLLFKEGNSYEPYFIEESERLLRSRPIFRFVRITPQTPENGEMDILVETEDVWTTTIRLSYGTAGGENFYNFGFLEHNFLGTGKSIGAFINKDIDRLVRGGTFEDVHFLGTRAEFFSGYGKDEKGEEWETHLTKPFYASFVRHSEGISIRHKDDEDRLFENGKEISRFNHKTDEKEIFGALAVHSHSKRVRRILISHQWKRDLFSLSPETLPGQLPEKRVTSAVLAGFMYQNLEFQKTRGVFTFDRDEDVNHGWDWMMVAGPSLKSWGATQNGWLSHARINKVWGFGARSLWFNQWDYEARYENKLIQNGILKLKSQYFYLFRDTKQSAFIRTEYTGSKNLDSEDQFLLGGENGLRGYSVRQFSGSKKLLVTVETRRVIIYDWLHLMHLGWAVFGDSGAAWKEHTSLDKKDFKSDVGLGLRLAPSRSFDPGLIRIDVAYALNDNNRDHRWVINIGGQLSFGEKSERKFDQ